MSKTVQDRSVVTIERKLEVIKHCATYETGITIDLE